MNFIKVAILIEIGTLSKYRPSLMANGGSTKYFNSCKHGCSISGIYVQTHEFSVIQVAASNSIYRSVGDLATPVPTLLTE